MNYIIFNHDGSIKNVNFAEIIVQGNNLVDEIFVAVEGRSTDSYLATAYFELPNGESNFLTATPASQSIDQSAYNGYKFLLTGAQTALYGRVRMSLKLEGMQGETLWTYEQVLTVNKSGYNPDFTMISMSQYAALVKAMGSLQEKFVVNNARFYSSLANAQADLDNLAFNQCVIIADVTATDPIPEIYFKNAESQLELLAGIGEYAFQAGTTTTQTLSPGSDATVSVSFVASGKTITMNFTFGIPRGNTGATGNGISSIAKISTEGQVDTYRITYTNGNHFDFDVTNGTLAGHLLSSTFEYDDVSTDSLSLQLATEIRRLVDADGSKVKSIMASKPTSAGGVTTYSIIWKYNVNIIPGVLNIQDGDFYFENDGVLTSIDSHLEDYTFSIFHEIEGTSVEDFGYVEIDDTTKVGSGTLTQAELVELRKPISFIRYQTGVRSYDMLISYYSARQANNTISKYFRGFMHKGSEDFDSAYAYNLSRSFITVTNLNSTTTGGWTYSLNVDAYVDKTPTQNSTDLITSGGVHSAVSTLDSKISKNAEDIAALTEAIIKKDLYETQEATFQGMAAVPAGAMVKAYLDGFKGNSAVVNQLVQNGDFSNGTTGWSAIETGLLSASSGVLTVQARAAYDGARIQVPNCIVGHKYLVYFTASNDKRWVYQVGGVETRFSSSSSAIVVSGIVEALTTSPNLNFFSDESGTSTLTLRNVMLIDLTAVPLTSAEMADVATAKAALKHKGMDVDEYIPYNLGTLTDSKPTKLISYGYNLFDGELAVGSIGPNGQELTTTDAIRTVNFIKVFGGYEYKCEFSDTGGNTFGTYFIVEYDKDKNFIVRNAIYSQPISTKTLQSNTRFVKLVAFSTQAVTTTGVKICFHLSSADLGYKPYVAPIEYDLTMPALKSAGSVQDESKAGGEKVGKLDLSVLHFVTASYGYILPNRVDGMKYNAVSDYVSIANILASKYTNASYNDVSQGRTSGAIAIGTEAYPYILVSDTSAPSGNMNYELATPTDFSDPISYPEIFDVYAGGSVEVVGEGCDATAKVYFYVEA